MPFLVSIETGVEGRAYATILYIYQVISKIKTKQINSGSIRQNSVSRVLV